jgi:hypothetical protein
VIRARAGWLRWLLREEETSNMLRIGLSNVDWFFYVMQGDNLS